MRTPVTSGESEACGLPVPALQQEVSTRAEPGGDSAPSFLPSFGGPGPALRFPEGMDVIYRWAGMRAQINLGASSLLPQLSS